MPLLFWNGMNRRQGVKLVDKLMVGNSDNQEAEYIDIVDLQLLLAGGGLRKNGYRMIKGYVNNIKNQDDDNWEENDEFIGDGEWFPGYYVHGFIADPSLDNIQEDTRIIANIKK